MPVKPNFGRFLFSSGHKWFFTPIFLPNSELFHGHFFFFHGQVFGFFSRFAKIRFDDHKSIFFLAIVFNSTGKTWNFFTDIDISFTGGIFGKI